MSIKAYRDRLAGVRKESKRKKKVNDQETERLKQEDVKVEESQKEPKV